MLAELESVIKFSPASQVPKIVLISSSSSTKSAQIE
jgi:hypothetical protein